MTQVPTDNSNAELPNPLSSKQIKEIQKLLKKGSENYTLDYINKFDEKFNYSLSFTDRLQIFSEELSRNQIKELCFWYTFSCIKEIRFLSCVVETRDLLDMAGDDILQAGEQFFAIEKIVFTSLEAQIAFICLQIKDYIKSEPSDSFDIYEELLEILEEYVSGEVITKDSKEEIKAALENFTSKYILAQDYGDNFRRIVFNSLSPSQDCLIFTSPFKLYTEKELQKEINKVKSKLYAQLLTLLNYLSPEETFLYASH